MAQHKDFVTSMDNFLLDPDFLASLDEAIDVNHILNQFKQEPPAQPPATSVADAAPSPSPSPSPSSGSSSTVTGAGTAPVPSWFRSPVLVDAEIGKTINGRTQSWVLGKIIAKCDKSTVREARGEDGRDVAVKILPIDERAEKEATVARHLSGHINVPDFYDSAKTEEHMYIFMERADGDLYQIIDSSERGLDEHTARRWFSQLVAAVSHCHRLGYVHSDLKPENALISNGVLKLTDWGAVQSTDMNSEGGHTEGTIQYAAPERFCELVSPGYSHPRPSTSCPGAIDLWSLGIILYTLCTKQFPFVEPSTRCRRYCKFVGGGDDLILAGLSSGLKELIRKLLNPEPDERMSLDELIRHHWMCEDGEEGAGDTAVAMAMPPPSLTQPVGACAEACRAECYSDRGGILEATRTVSAVSCN